MICSCISLMCYYSSIHYYWWKDHIIHETVWLWENYTCLNLKKKKLRTWLQKHLKSTSAINMDSWSMSQLAPVISVLYLKEQICCFFPSYFAWISLMAITEEGHRLTTVTCNWQQKPGSCKWHQAFPLRGCPYSLFLDFSTYGQWLWLINDRLRVCF